MNIYDISKQAGVSIATVSRVMNGNTNVSEKTRQKVLSIMEENGYTPNAFARGLGLNSMKTIGILCADSSDIYLANAVYYIEQELRKNGYDSLLCCTGYTIDTKKSYLELLLSKRVDAVILVGSNFVENEPMKNQYIFDTAKKIPIMLINGLLDCENIYSTVCDDYHAIFDATDSLLKEGRLNLLYMYRSLSYSGRRKLDGFLAAHLIHGQDVKSSHTVCCQSGNIDDAKQAFEQLYNEGLMFDGVLSSDDEIAIGAIKFAKDHKISIPEDLSIVGYNNSKLACCCEPELTSVNNKVELLSTTTVATLMKVLNGYNVPRHTVVTAEIVIRNTTASNY